MKSIGPITGRQGALMVDRTDLRFTFTAGNESFEVMEFTLHEGLSETFLLQVESTSANTAIDFGQVLDRNGLLAIWQGGSPVRYVHGAVSSFVQGDTGFRRTRYSTVDIAEQVDDLVHGTPRKAPHGAKPELIVDPVNAVRSI
ncbi:contractile injection system protein, VgrG/Pvc8 family [Burkholderia cepacia]|uniref:contractile injection system protein, VgrG/Pvc8 family n=1 Tax=Burkholderia cepacia TaxID=292 RepID=UPI00075FE779|nr:contractile injection system protein, VgrG/Pvc8 family [Burkholderia cepacia]